MLVHDHHHPAIMKRLKADFMHAIAHEETAQAIKTIIDESKCTDS
jgi:hypothetical protein